MTERSPRPEDLDRLAASATTLAEGQALSARADQMRNQQRTLPLRPFRIPILGN